MGLRGRANTRPDLNSGALEGNGAIVGSSVTGHARERPAPSQKYLEGDMTEDAQHELNQTRLDAEWCTLVALREMLGMSQKGGASPTYDDAFALGKDLAPTLFASRETRLVPPEGKDERVAREFLQRAEAINRLKNRPVTAVDLLRAEIQESTELLKAKGETREIEHRISDLRMALASLLQNNTENDAIIRDIFRADRDLGLPNLPEPARGCQLSRLSPRSRAWTPDSHAASERRRAHHWRRPHLRDLLDASASKVGPAHIRAVQGLGSADLVFLHRKEPRRATQEDECGLLRTGILFPDAEQQTQIPIVYPIAPRFYASRIGFRVRMPKRLPPDIMCRYVSWTSALSRPARRGAEN